MARFIHKNITVEVVIQNGLKKRTFPIHVHYIIQEADADNIKPTDFVLEADWSDYLKKEGTVAIKVKKNPAQVLREDIFFIKRLKVE